MVAPAKLFSPYSNWTWYVTEMDPVTGTCFGLVEGFETELGYFDLTELSEVTVLGGVPAVERDLYWEPHDPGRDQEAVVGDCGLANGGYGRNQRTNKEGEDHA